MAIPKVLGTETEYGISGVGRSDFNPVLTSSLLISTYAGSLRRIRWDYEQESPLRDARGFEPVQVREPAEEDLGLANVILPNGARYYVDHAHPEYSTPECVSARGLETTLKRPIINTRDEPHADPDRYRRLHVIVGDANLCEVAIFLKLGTTALVLEMIEDDYLPDLSISNPVAALHRVSQDVTCTAEVALADGRRRSAVQLQWEYLERAAKYVEQEHDTEDNREILRRWEAVLEGLESDPMGLHRELDWVAKYRLLEGYRQRDGLDWADHKLRLVDLQYHDVRRDKGLYQRLAATGKVERLAPGAGNDRAGMG